MYQLANDILEVPRTHDGFMLEQSKKLFKDWQQGYKIFHYYLHLHLSMVMVYLDVELYIVFYNNDNCFSFSCSFPWHCNIEFGGFHESL